MDQQGFGERLEKIEVKLAYLEDFVTRLQEEVLARNTLMDRLMAENQAMKERLLQLTRNGEEIPNRRPPHY
jgi:SlyX protein